MPTTVPNQRMVCVHRERVTSDFLGIKNTNWQAAARDLGAHAFLLYIYFASNADGYSFALSPAAIRKAIGMPPQTYRDQFIKLLDKGYLVQTGKNRYEFYETPIRGACENEMAAGGGFADTFAVEKTTKDVPAETSKSREINNINITNSNKYTWQWEKQVSPLPEKFEF